MESTVQTIRNGVLTSLFIALFISVFAIVGIITRLLRFIEENLKEYAVNMLCGASRKDIVARVFLQVLAVMLIPQIIVLCFFGICLPLLFTEMLGALIVLFVFLVLRRKLKKDTIVDVMRKG